ncbi:hypothetical protein TSAR_006936 [Trichomalopsis sarcophagae]|uniref:Septin n=1 Tax=Trichomalopsis sarcophagae TaxID=543379 RepID=A0A232EID3_9HYME|nr:hypothetical protein TSAR_006936 [Trichomalopsis sarcophagae]
MKNSKPCEPFTRHSTLQGHIGFDSLPYQLVNKSATQGFVFNILCIGETGIGKSTLMDSLFNTTFESHQSPHTLEKVKLKANTYELRESNVRLKLTIVNTVGYGDQVNKSNSLKDILDYIEAQFEDYLQEELKIKRSMPSYQDTRIHACLYFICPTGHGLKAIDLVCMQKLDKKVNIIPIIAKADTISSLELKHFKNKVIGELGNFGVDIYKFPTDDESVADVNMKMNAQIPFAVVGSTDFIRVGNKMMRSREYPWGVVEVENESHSDFVKLREMLIRTNMEDMRDKTHNYHYELYRRKRLQELGFEDTENEEGRFSYQRVCEMKKAAFEQETQQREDDMRKSFVIRVKDTEAELKEAQKELYDKFEQLKQDCAEEKKRLDEERQQLEKEIKEFNRLKVQATCMQYQSTYTLTLRKNKRKP